MRFTAVGAGQIPIERSVAGSAPCSMLSENYTSREVTQAGSGSVVEAEACSERRGPVEGSMGNSAESPTATTCSAPQISLPTVTKPASECGPVAVGTLGPPAPPAGTLEEAVSPVPASRKRRWDSSTTAAAKQQQPSGGFSSLKSLIPDVPPAVDSSSQEAVVELHPEEGRLSGDEEEEEQGTAGGLHVQRAVTQMASAGKQENGQKEGPEEEDEEDEAGGGGDRQRPLKEERKDCSLVAMETQAPPTPEAPSKKAPPSGTRVRHSSQQKSGVSLTAEDPVCSAQKPPPPHSKGTNIIHICNLVRPFTLGQLKELLNETGAVVEEGFWIDKIKSHCYVTYPSVEEAVAARTALQGLKWPQTNPRFLRVDFCQQDELDHHRAQLDGVGAVQREGGGVGEWDQQAQRQRERERRERARGEREWDRDKVADFSRPGEDQRSPAHPPERRDQPRTENPPGKLLDDLFCKTKAPPCIYWLPLTEQQALQRKAERAERMKEREKRRKELQQEEDRKREERRAGRSKEAGGVAEGGGASQPVTGEREKESEKVRENEKVRDKENETEKVRGKEDREREEKDKERGKEMGRGEKEKERERGRGRESKEEERDKGRGREEKEKERGKVTGQGEKAGERARGREEKEGERERGRGREEKERERGRGRGEREEERERGKRRDGYSGRREDSKSRGGRRSRSHSNPPPPRDRRH